MLRVWRQNYGYADDLLTSLTLFLLSPLTVMAYLALGLPGLAFCFLPMLRQNLLKWNRRLMKNVLPQATG